MLNKPYIFARGLGITQLRFYQCVVSWDSKSICYCLEFSEGCPGYHQAFDSIHHLELLFLMLGLEVLLCLQQDQSQLRWDCCFISDISSIFQAFIPKFYQQEGSPGGDITSICLDLCGTNNTKRCLNWPFRSPGFEFILNTGSQTEEWIRTNWIQMWAPPPRFSSSVCLEWGLRFCISNQFQVMLISCWSL